MNTNQELVSTPTRAQRRGQHPKPEPVPAIMFGMAAYAIRNTKRGPTETNGERNLRATYPILGPGWTRKRVRRHMPCMYAPCPCESGKQFKWCCWESKYARL